MKKSISIILFLSVSTFTYGQTNTTVRKIFYNLPLDASRKAISLKLNSDTRFKSTDDASNPKSSMSETSFIGLSSDFGLIKTAPDSLEVELTWGSSYGLKSKKRNDKLSGDLHFKSRYYYSSRNSAEKEYQNMLSVLRTLTRDTLTVAIDTVYSDSPLRSQFKAHGVTFVFHKPYYKVEVLYATITKDYFGLFLDYTRKEE